MLTVLPTVLAVLGTLLMAVVIFAPATAARSVTASCAPPVPCSAHDDTAPMPWHAERFASDSWNDAPARVLPALVEPHIRVPSWPELVDARASGLGAEARATLARALGEVRAPWAEAILRFAVDDEVDDEVRAMLTAALSA